MKNNLSPTSFNDLYSEPADNILKLRLQMKRLMHQAMSDVLDPSRLFTSTLLKKSCVQTPLDKDPVKSYAQRGNAAGHITRAGTAPLPSKSKPNNICETRDVSTPLTHSKYFTTSIGVRAIYENAASDPATRRLLRRSATTPYVSIPGLKNPKYEGQDSLIDTSNWNDRHESVLTDDFEASIEFPKKFPQNDVEEVSTNAFPRSSRGCTADSLHSPIKTSRFGAGTRAGTADTASTSRKVSAAALSFAKTPESHGIPSGSSRIRRDLKRSFRTTAEMNIRPNYDYSLAKTKELSKMESAIASAKYLYGDEYLENNRELLQQTAKNSELKHEEDVLVDAQVDTATPLVIPQPYFETKQHNRYTRSLDEAKLSLQAYRNSRGALSERYANSFEMKEENENPEEALPTLYPTADKIVNKSFLVRTVDAVKYANDNKVESAPQNHYYFDPADFIKYRTGSSAGKLGKTEETALEKIQRLKEEADVKASNLSKNTSSIAKTRASIQVILEQRRAKMLENTDTTPSDKKKNVRANVAFTSTVNNEKHPTIKLPTKKLKVPKLSEYEVCLSYLYSYY